MLQPTLPGQTRFRARSTAQMQSELRILHCLASVNELYCWRTEGEECERREEQERTKEGDRDRQGI